MSSGSIDALYGSGPLHDAAHPKPRPLPPPVPPPLPKSRAAHPQPRPAPVPIPVPRPIPLPPKDKSVVDPTYKKPKSAEEQTAEQAPRTWGDLIAATLRRREFVVTTISSIVHMVLIILLALFTIAKVKNKQVNLTASPDREVVQPDIVESPVMDMPMVAAGPQVRSIVAQSTVVKAPKNLGKINAPVTVANLDSMIMSDSVKSGGAGGLDSVSFFGSTAIAKRVVFVVDNSQSMDGPRWERAKEEILTAVSNLSAQQQFYVFFFSDRDYPMLGAKAPTGMIKLDVPFWEAFQPWVNQLELNGDTMAESALRKAYAMKPDVIFLMTDGEFFDNTVEFLMKMKYSKVRVNTIGFQTSDDGREVLKKIAETLKGEYTDVR